MDQFYESEKKKGDILGTFCFPTGKVECSKPDPVSFLLGKPSR